ncbi:RNA-directed RNA polymerase L [Striga asiatica]|uniref:RNA-directed RNA polymerase L n=1 Tax=Striga asiatica TaxID=4170 RepID=A0A5A7QBQ0_STRAF|nr:RNA-directed RNA polymerase L [Striga asiatica]
MILPKLQVLNPSRQLNLLTIRRDFNHGQQNPTVPVAKNLLTCRNQMKTRVVRESGFRRIFFPKDRVEVNEPPTNYKHFGRKIEQIVHALDKAVRSRGSNHVQKTLSNNSLNSRIKSEDLFKIAPDVTIRSTTITNYSNVNICTLDYLKSVKV